MNFYRDMDGDGHGDATMSVTAYSAPMGYVASSDDCNDRCPSCFPGALEMCDGNDNDCNGKIDDGGQTTYYRDADGDGFGNIAITTSACSAPAGYVANNTDCNDAAGSGGSIHPGATEVCFNGTDDNCNGAQDEAPECSIDCNWNGARWLSHGFDGGNAFKTGAWVSCINSKLTYISWVNGGTFVNPSPAGTGDALVGCNWGNANRWVSQGYDGNNAFAFGAIVGCSGTRVTNLAWANNQLNSGQISIATSGVLGCNWSGAVYLSNGIDDDCAWRTGMNVTCNNDHLTNFEFVEGAGCSRHGP